MVSYVIDKGSVRGRLPDCGEEGAELPALLSQFPPGAALIL